MASGRFRRYRRQFGWLRGVRYWLVDRVVRLLEHGRRAAYAQCGEDRVLELLLGAKSDGFYVDVGAHDPIRYSNTFALYKRGWRGIAIDANPAFAVRYRRVRPRDQVVTAAVSDRERQATFTTFENPDVSSLTPSHVETWRSRSAIRSTHDVTTRTLTSILAELDAPARFDVLSVDVEGEDVGVLRGLDFERFRPRWIVVEMHGFRVERPEASEAYALLASHGYGMRSLAGYSGIFRDTTESA